MTIYAVRVFYIGSQYYGSQWQPNAKTVQGELIDGLCRWSGENHSRETVRFSGRTDRGVHSIGQIALITSKTELNLKQINKHLPDDIIIWASIPVPIDFNPRHNILMRHYRYYLDNINLQLNLPLIKAAAQILIGSHDFSLLSKPDVGRNPNTTILNIYAKEKNGHLIIDFFGTRFLWKLVRKTISLLKMIGTGDFSLDIITDLFEKRDMIPGGIEPAPPGCLFLMESAVPFKMKVSKSALKKIKKHFENQLKLFDRYVKTFTAVSEDLFSEQEILF